MYCPQCSTESSSSQQFCRSCGANLKMIAKAVTLSETIARSDRGPMPKIKEMIKGLKVDHVGEEISRALEQMNREISKSFDKSKPKKGFPWKRSVPTPEERRERSIRKGVESLFTGAGLSIFLYYLAGALVLRIPPEYLAKVPFEIQPVVHVIWLIGALPIFSGVGKIISGLLIRTTPRREIAGTVESEEEGPVEKAEAVTAKTSRIVSDRERAHSAEKSPRRQPDTVTDHTTELLN
jgi:hypothetical protein